MRNYKIKFKYLNRENRENITAEVLADNACHNGEWVTFLNDPVKEYGNSQVVAMFRTEEIVSIDSVPAIAEIKVRHGEEK